MNEIAVTSWNELSDRLHELAWNPSLNRLRSNFVYRGMPCQGYGLMTSLQRLGGPYHNLEAAILASFRKYAGPAAVEEDSRWNWLAVAQHHGLPTRLLDWTYSPFVALHFVMERIEWYDRDGVIWCVDRKAAHERLPQQLPARLEAENTDVFTAEMLTAVAPTPADFDALADEEFVAFFEPPSLDQRLVNQLALFSLMSSLRARLDTWLRRHPKVFRRLIIPARMKWEVRDRLDEANVTERVLYPGLDGLSRWLRRYYMPRRAEGDEADEADEVDEANEAPGAGAR